MATMTDAQWLIWGAKVVRPRLVFAEQAGLQLHDPITVLDAAESGDVALWRSVRHLAMRKAHEVATMMKCLGPHPMLPAARIALEASALWPPRDGKTPISTVELGVSWAVNYSRELYSPIGGQPSEQDREMGLKIEVIGRGA